MTITWGAQGATRRPQEGGGGEKMVVPNNRAWAVGTKAVLRAANLTCLWLHALHHVAKSAVAMLPSKKLRYSTWAVISDWLRAS